MTADALNCQRAIAQQIVDQDGDFVLALKGNPGPKTVLPPRLRGLVTSVLRKPLMQAADFTRVFQETTNQSAELMRHGRIEIHS